MYVSKKNVQCREFPGSLVVRIWRFQWKPRYNPWSGNWDSASNTVQPKKAKQTWGGGRLKHCSTRYHYYERKTEKVELKYEHSFNPYRLIWFLYTAFIHFSVFLIFKIRLPTLYSGCPFPWKSTLCRPCLLFCL